MTTLVTFEVYEGQRVAKRTVPLQTILSVVSVNIDEENLASDVPHVRSQIFVNGGKYDSPTDHDANAKLWSDALDSEYQVALAITRAGAAKTTIEAPRERERPPYAPMPFRKGHRYLRDIAAELATMERRVGGMSAVRGAISRCGLAADEDEHGMFVTDEVANKLFAILNPNDRGLLGDRD